MNQTNEPDLVDHCIMIEESSQRMVEHHERLKNILLSENNYLARQNRTLTRVLWGFGVLVVVLVAPYVWLWWRLR